MALKKDSGQIYSGTTLAEIIGFFACTIIRMVEETIVAIGKRPLLLNMKKIAKTRDCGRDRGLGEGFQPHSIQISGNSGCVTIIPSWPCKKWQATKEGSITDLFRSKGLAFQWDILAIN